MAKFVSPLDQLRTDWDRRARENALAHACPQRPGIDLRTYLETGHELCRQRVVPALELLASETAAGERRALDLGCGPGRLLAPLADLVGRVHGVDVSPEMLRLAAANAGDDDRIRLHVGDGMTLQCVRRLRFDLAVCAGVLRHVADDALLRYLLRQLGHRLTAGGVALLEFDVERHGNQSDLHGHLADTALEMIDHTREDAAAWVLARREPGPV